MSQTAAEISASNAWVESYLNALLTFGLSSEYAGATKENVGAPDADRTLYSRYYVRSLLKLDEDALKNAWSKAASATRQGGDKDARLQYLSWRIWHLKRKHAEVERLRHNIEGLDSFEFDGAPPSRDYSSDEEGASPISGAGHPYPFAKVEAGDLAPAPSLKKVSVKLPDASGAANAAAGAGALAIAMQPGSGVPTPAAAIDALFEDYMLSPAETTPLGASHKMEPQRLDRLYVVMISLHGLIRGDRMELGRDSDTGGQVKYVVELARAMALHPAVHRVDLLTRLIRDPRVDPEYGVEEECIVKGRGDNGGAYIVRLPCGPTNQYINKESLWPHVREFADRGVAHATRMLSTLSESGRRCELYCVHGHYADAGEAAVLMCSTLDTQMAMTGHSLGRNKLDHLLNSASMTRAEIEMTYAISRRIEAEERSLDVASLVFTSTQQEIEEQWGLYDGYNPTLARILRFRRSVGRHMPYMKVSPPGLDFSTLKVTMPEDPVVKEFEKQRATLQEFDLAPLSSPLSLSPRSPTSPGDGSKKNKRNEAGTPSSATTSDQNVSFPPGRRGTGAASSTPQSPTDAAGVSSPTGTVDSSSGGGGGMVSSVQIPPIIPPRPADIIPNGPPIWQDIAKFLRNPLKPAVLAMSRPDAKKNITTLVKAFGEHAMLRELANLVLIMGNRDTIDSMAGGSQKILTQVLKLIDAHDLYGAVSYPKHHTQADISDIYLFARETRGVFVNIALQEPFGLTVIEAAAHGVPTVATRNGGPVDIMATLHHGVVVDPTDSDAVAAALLSILTAPSTWSSMSTSGVDNIMAYSWPAHCKRYMETMDVERRFNSNTKVKHDRSMSGFLTRRLSRLDLLGIVDTEVSATLSGSPSHGVVSEGMLTMQRHFSTPGDMTPTDLRGSLSHPSSPLGKKISGLTTDDLDIISSLAKENATRGGKGPQDSVAATRKRLIVVPLDSDKVISDVVFQLRQLISGLNAAGLSSDVGIGVLSMLGFDSTYDHIVSGGIDVDNLDFMVCNSGADAWLRHDSRRWEADEAYESLIEFHWDRVALHRMLKKIISSQADNQRRLPRLKELLYNVAEEPEAGVHPRHICVDLDPETQGILAAGMGPKARSAGSVRLASAVTERLKRRLRTKGFRANYTLQFVPQDGPSSEHLAVLHITPIRASRPLALRAISHRLNIPMDNFIVIALPPVVFGESLADAVVGPATSDVSDLVAGAQKAIVVRPDSDTAQSREDLATFIGTRLAPFQDMDKVKLCDKEGVVQHVVDFVTNVAAADGEAAAANGVIDEPGMDKKE
ncbi:putative sucrose-phosphate synthase 1 [Nannochloris sp. 'desiccata']|nr:putative sucrose-phosphate synthase 1 [Chlorella desiccata (nom. nud.)]